MAVSGQHWSEDVRAEVKRRLSAPNAVPTHVAKEMGLRRETVRRYAKELQEGIDMPNGSEAPFTVQSLPSSDIPLDELIARRRDESARVIEADEARKLIPVTINTPGPVGLMIFGDPHIDDPGCDFARLESHLKIAAARPKYLFAGNIGDVQNNWIGRLERLHAKQGTTTSDAWRLVEWMMTGAGVNWLFLIRGNHDVWSGGRDPLNWIMRGSNGVDQPHGSRLALTHPGGVETRLHARHDFKGGSIYHDLHGLKRELSFGFRDHILVAGHRHIGGDEGTIAPGGTVAQLVRVSGYKAVDDYADQGQFPKKAIHPAALVIIDPSKPDSARDRVWCAPSVEEGAEYLDWKRARFEGRARVTVRAA